MKTWQVLMGASLLLSGGLNLFLWWQRAHHREELAVLREHGAKMERKLVSLREQSNSPVARSDLSTRELARLRNEVTQLRKQAAGASATRGEAHLLAQLTAATQSLAEAEAALSQSAKLTPEERERSRSILCVQNLKQIGLAARVWANENEEKSGREMFPPGFLAMKEELERPNILFCPSAPDEVKVKEWAQLNPVNITYTYLQPGISATNYSEGIFQCPIHLHVCLGDGSVQSQR